MVEGEVVLVAAILAAEPVAQENIEPCESGIKRGFNISFEGNDAWQADLKARTSNGRLIFGDDVDAVQKHRLHRLLPTPERQRIVAQRAEVGVQNQGRTRVRKGGMSVHKLASSRFAVRIGVSNRFDEADTNRA
jgi:hypothetical protein